MTLKDTMQSALHRLSDAVEASFETSLFGTTVDAADLKVFNLQNAFQALEVSFSSYLAEINNARNTAIPIYKLPDEVLVTVIDYVLTDCGEYIVHNADTFESYRYEELSNISMVSKRWYSVVTSAPSLWTTVPVFGSPALISAIATRSGALPLRIEGKIVAYDDDDESSLNEVGMMLAIRWRLASVTRILGPQLHRWQAVDLDLREYSLEPLDDVLEEPAPSVRSVALSLSPYQAREMGRLNLFAGQAENLRHIKLERVYADWGSPVFRGLTTLALSETNWKGGPSMSELLEVLRGSPGLEKLSLHNLNLGSETEWQESAPVSMKQLRELTLSSLKTGVAEYIVRHIQDLDNCGTMNIDFVSNHTIELSSLQATFAHLRSTMERIFSPSKRLIVQIQESMPVFVSLSGESSFSFSSFGGREGTADSVLAWLPTVLNPSSVNIPVHLQVNAREELSTLSHVRLLNVVMLEVTEPVRRHEETDWNPRICCRPLLKLLGGFQTEGWEEGPAFPRLKKFRVDYTDGWYVHEVEEMIANRYSIRTPPGFPKLQVSLPRRTALLALMRRVAAVVGHENVLVHGTLSNYSRAPVPQEEDPGHVYQRDSATEFSKTLEDSTCELEDG